MIKLNTKKIIAIASFIILMITSLSLLLNNSHVNKELPKVKLKNSINSSNLAIMVESDYQTEQYTKWENKEFPTDGYTLNRIKSGCVDKNGKDVDALTYNESDKTISIKAKQSIYCYLYYDNLFRGNGTEQEPYEINYIEDLVRLSNSVNKDSNTYTSKYFILKRNLDFNKNDSYMKYNDKGFGDINGVSGVEGIKEELTNQEGSGFVPIGNYSKSFEGNIDGKNNKISNLWIYNTIDENQAIGFIGVLSNGSISNLTLSGEIHVEGRTSIGSFVNRISNSTIDNCTNEINITSDTGDHALGGIVGWSNGNATIKNSTNKGNITNGGQTGGIIGSNNGGILTIENCKNYGKIENNLGNIIGGIVGQSVHNNTVKTIIKNSSNYVELKSNNVISGGNIGGIIGVNGKNLEITNCYNEGDIYFKENSANNMHIAGGIIGDIRIASEEINILNKIENCYNAGNITGGNRIGGIVGKINPYNTFIIDKCYNIGNLFSKQINTSGTIAGGLIGSDWKSTKVIILNSYNKGNVESLPNDYVGQSRGFVGGPNDGVGTTEGYIKIINSYNSGDITGSDKYSSSGISSSAITYDTLTLNNVYNIGNVKSMDNSTPNYAIGSLTNGSYTINNTYYKNTLAGSNIANEGGIAMEESAMKNQTFADLLNSNLASIDLKTIDPLLDGYTLVNWVIDPVTGYPTLDYNLES